MREVRHATFGAVESWCPSTSGRCELVTHAVLIPQGDFFQQCGAGRGIPHTSEELNQ